MSVSPVRDGKGEITRYINAIEDVTAQVEVMQRLIERTARLNTIFDLSPDGFAVFDACGELITKNPALRAMVGEVSPWMPLSGLDPWMQLQELLDLSCIEARQGKDFHIVATPLAAIVHAAVNGTGHQELGRQVSVGTLPDVQVMADASKIEQALTNLLSNTFKYSPTEALSH